ncbi:MAG: ATP-binding protein [Phycisphaerales bacterium]
MTLLRKFGILLGGLALIVAVSLTAAMWAVLVHQRELAQPLSSIHSVLGDLNRVKRAVAEIGALLPGSTPDRVPWTTPPDQTADADPRIAQLAVEIRDRLARLRDTGVFNVQSGISTTRNLEQRVREALAQIDRWRSTRDPAFAAASHESLFVIHELVERNETKMLEDARVAVIYGRDVRGTVTVVIAASLAAVLLAAGLGLALTRRWVVRPVAELRAATERLGAGDFSHRVPVVGRDELALLSAEVNHMASVISTMQDERVERERLAAIGEMVRRLAHNLRNPLAGIRSLAELARADLPPGSQPRESQDRIVQTVDRFERWLRELLSATSPLVVQPVESAVVPWLDASLEALRPMAAAKQIDLAADSAAAPARARFDGRHLEQALVALVTNAIQAAPPGSTVRILARADGTHWELRVADNGPGVPIALSDKIFKPYFTTKRDGTGIGLALVKQVVEQHGGRVWVERANAESKVAVGAAFVIRLPIHDQQQVANPGQRDGESGGIGGQNPGSRGRNEPAVLNPSGVVTRRA